MKCEVTVRAGGTTLVYARVDAERTADALQEVLQRKDVQQHLRDMRCGGISAHVAVVNDLRAVAGVTDAPQPWEAAA